MTEEPFITWLKLGKIRIKDGTIEFLRAYNILFPVSCLLQLGRMLEGEIGKKKAKEFLREIGRFQIKQAIVRYDKILELKEIDKQKWKDFGDTILKILGFGKFSIVINYEEKRMTLKSENQPIAIQYRLMFGKADKPIDDYLCGILEEVGTCTFGLPMKCIETKCIACGDPYCQFEVFPVKKKVK